MAYKDLLLTLTTFPEPTAPSALDQAVGFAAVMGAQLSAIVCEPKFRTPGSILGDSLLDIPALAAEQTRRSAANADALLASFKDLAKKRGVAHQESRERCYPSDIPRVLTEYARLRDLTIVPVPGGEFWDGAYAEAIIFGSGRPALVVSDAAKAIHVAPNTVVVAWDFSRPAARAVADAMPILKKAEEVYVVTVTQEKAIDAATGANLLKHLRIHGIAAKLDTVEAAGRSIGDSLEAYAELPKRRSSGYGSVRPFPGP